MEVSFTFGGLRESEARSLLPRPIGLGNTRVLSDGGRHEVLRGGDKTGVVPSHTSFKTAICHLTPVLLLVLWTYLRQFLCLYV